MATQFRVLRQADALQHRLQRCRLRVHDARAGKPLEPRPRSPVEAEEQGTAIDDHANEMPALPPLPRHGGTVDPMLSQLVTRALTGRFSAAASRAMAATLAAEAHQLLARLEHCPLRLLADVLGTHGYATLHDLTSIGSADAGRILNDVLKQLDTAEAATPASAPPAASYPSAQRSDSSAGARANISFPAARRADGEGSAGARSRSPPPRQARVQVEAVAASAAAAAVGHALPAIPSLKPFAPFSLSSSGGAALMNAPLVSPIDRGIVIPDHSAVLGCVLGLRWGRGDVGQPEKRNVG